MSKSAVVLSGGGASAASLCSLAASLCSLAVSLSSLGSTCSMRTSKRVDRFSALRGAAGVSVRLRTRSLSGATIACWRACARSARARAHASSRSRDSASCAVNDAAARLRGLRHGLTARGGSLACSAANIGSCGGGGGGAGGASAGPMRGCSLARSAANIGSCGGGGGNGGDRASSTRMGGSVHGTRTSEMAGAPKLHDMVCFGGKTTKRRSSNAGGSGVASRRLSFKRRGFATTLSLSLSDIVSLPLPVAPSLGSNKLLSALRDSYSTTLSGTTNVSLLAADDDDDANQSSCAAFWRRSRARRLAARLLIVAFAALLVTKFYARKRARAHARHAE